MSVSISTRRVDKFTLLLGLTGVYEEDNTVEKEGRIYVTNLTPQRRRGNGDDRAGYKFQQGYRRQP